MSCMPLVNISSGFHIYHVMKVIDEGGTVNIVYMDFSNIFSKVPNGKLIKKIKAHRIHEFFNQVKNWLCHKD